MAKKHKAVASLFSDVLLLLTWFCCSAIHAYTACS